MKSKIFTFKNMVTLIVFIIIVAIGVLVNWVRGVSEDAIVKSSFEEVERIGTQYKNFLENILQESEEDLMLIAQSISDNDIDGDNVVEFFKSQSQTNEFDLLYYIDTDGNGISRYNEKQDFSNSNLFNNAMNYDYDTTNSYIALMVDEKVFCIVVPVIKSGETVAMLYSQISIEYFFDEILEDKDYEGDVFFVDEDLNIMYSSESNSVEYVTVLQLEIEEIGIENIDKAQSEIINKQDGGFYYDYQGEPKIMVYYSIAKTNIAIGMNVVVQSVSSEIITAAKYFDIIGSTVYWAAIALVLYITFNQTRVNKKLLKVAYFDPLTDLPNMAKLKLEMSTILENNKNKKYSVIVTDIENFKAINEMFGYEMGDRVLKTVKSFSESFNEPGLVTARIGSDKFAMFARSSFLDDLSMFAVAVSEHFDEVIPELADYAGTFKIGRYSIEEGETNFDDIMAKVNLAHLKSKATKGELLCDYDDTLKNQVKVEADITNKMYAALANNEFKVYLQPKFNTIENKFIGAEALSRWIESDGNLMYPKDFIPLFEKNGFIVELDKYILKHVCKTIKRWIDEGRGQVTVSVNCSRLNLENPNYVNEIIEIADKYDVPHECIEIELTESTTIENENTIEKLFLDLRENGFKISVDDFGAGYSSLGMLKNLHIDTLKMDRSFFSGGKNARRDDLLIESIVKMSHNLGMYVVAEGIETKEQVDLLKSMNCDAIQGYFYDKPLPIEDFEEKYCKNTVVDLANDVTSTEIVKNISDFKYTSSFVPTGIIVAKIDECFTIVEANNYYFEMIGYTREELRDTFDNRGISLISDDSRQEVLDYFNKQIKINANSYMSFICKVVSKSGNIHKYKISGKIAVNANGEPLIYASVIDVSEFYT